MAADMKVKKLEIRSSLKKQMTPSTTLRLDKLITPSTRKLVTSANFVINSSSNQKNTIRKAIIVLVAIIFGVYGILMLSLVQIHFRDAREFCQSVSIDTEKFGQSLVTGNNGTDSASILNDELKKKLEDHPELLLWDFCKFQVHPFNDYPCQCRQFETPEWQRFIWSVEELRTYFDIELGYLLTNILTEWHMLEKLRWEDIDIMYGSEKLPPINLTSEMFNAKKMRAISVRETNIEHIDPAISNWNLLQYFSFEENINLLELPESMGQLSKLKYFAFSGDFKIEKFAYFTCQMKELETLKMSNTKIPGLPHCIANITTLTSIIMTSSAHMSYFPLKIMNNQNLKEFDASLTNISWQQLVQFNNISNITQFEESFNPNPDTTYWLEGSQFCSDVNLSSIKVLEWIDESQCCDAGCDFKGGYVLNSLQCTGYQWNNGICDEECENAFCSYDGYDCSQLCDYDKCDVTNLGDGTCDRECNNAECKFDFGDCEIITNGNWSYEQCEETFENKYHQCNPEWALDDFCDSLCQNEALCGYDGDVDCSSCENNECAIVYGLFALGGNSITNDEHISTSEICAIWDVAIASGLVQEMITVRGPEYTNCSILIPEFDTNGDDLLNLHEMIVALYPVWNVTEEQAEQINCSACVGEFNYYN